MVIKKKITLEFLGEEYKDSYLVFKSITVGELDNLLKEIQDASADNEKSWIVVKKVIEDRFIEGKVFEDTELKDFTKEDLNSLPLDAFFEVLSQLRGKIPENLPQP